MYPLNWQEKEEILTEIRNNGLQTETVVLHLTQNDLRQLRRYLNREEDQDPCLFWDLFGHLIQKGEEYVQNEGC